MSSFAELSFASSVCSLGVGSLAFDELSFEPPKKPAKNRANRPKIKSNRMIAPIMARIFPLPELFVATVVVAAVAASFKTASDDLISSTVALSSVKVGSFFSLKVAALMLSPSFLT